MYRNHPPFCMPRKQTSTILQETQKISSGAKELLLFSTAAITISEDPLAKPQDLNSHKKRGDIIYLFRNRETPVSINKKSGTKPDFYLPFRNVAYPSASFIAGSASNRSPTNP
ncbi:hypothetical protein, partial [Sedimenticola sp.]|uniref:hypothetical protein n=1 Tax=Sedimenticola sp. TaxID=1940285 RepID=UPI003D14558C